MAHNNKNFFLDSDSDGDGFGKEKDSNGINDDFDLDDLDNFGNFGLGVKKNEATQKIEEVKQPDR